MPARPSQEWLAFLATSLGGSRRTFWRVPAVLGLALLTGWLLVPASHGFAEMVLGGWNGFWVLAGILLFRPARRGSWIVFGLGLMTIGIGTTGMEGAPILGIGLPSPNIFELLLVIGNGLQLVGLAGIVRSRGGTDRWGLVDIAVVLLAVLLIAWFGIVSPALSQGHLPLPLLGLLFVNVGTAIAFLGFCVRMFQGASRRPPSFWYLTAAMVAVLFSNAAFPFLIVHNAYTLTGPSDIGWVLAGILWPLAALHPSMSHLAESSSDGSTFRVKPERIVAMATAALIAPAIVIARANESLPGDLVIVGAGSIAMFVLVMARLLQALHQLDRSMTARDRVEAELRDIALRNTPTGLANRSMLRCSSRSPTRTNPSASPSCTATSTTSSRSTTPTAMTSATTFSSSRRLESSDPCNLAISPSDSVRRIRLDPARHRQHGGSHDRGGPPIGRDPRAIRDRRSAGADEPEHRCRPQRFDRRQGRHPA